MPDVPAGYTVLQPGQQVPEGQTSVFIGGQYYISPAPVTTQPSTPTPAPSTPPATTTSQSPARGGEPPPSDEEQQQRITMGLDPLTGLPPSNIPSPKTEPPKPTVPVSGEKPTTPTAPQFIFGSGYTGTVGVLLTKEPPEALSTTARMEYDTAYAKQQGLALPEYSHDELVAYQNARGYTAPGSGVLMPTVPGYDTAPQEQKVAGIPTKAAWEQAGQPKGKDIAVLPSASTVPPSPSIPEQPSRIYFQNQNDYKNAGSPPNSIITSSLPENAKYTVPDPLNAELITVGVQTDNPYQVVNNDALKALYNNNRPLYQEFLRIGNDALPKPATATITVGGQEVLPTAASLFESQQQAAQKEAIFSQLKEYGTPDNFNIAKALVNGVPTVVLQSAGFSNAVIDAQRPLLSYVNSDGRLRVDDAIREGVPLSTIQAAGYALTQQQYQDVIDNQAKYNQAVSQLAKYETADGSYRVVDFLRDAGGVPAGTTMIPSADKSSAVLNAVQTLKNANFTDSQIADARLQAFYSGTISPDEHPASVSWARNIVTDLNQWQAQLNEDTRNSYNEQKNTAAKLGVTAAGGLATLLTSLVTAPVSLAGQVISRPQDTPAIAWQTGKGMATQVASTAGNIVDGKYLRDITQNKDLSALVADTGMTYLILDGLKGTADRVVTWVVPRGIPTETIAKEVSTGRIPVSGDEVASQYATAANKVEKLATERGGAFTGEVPIEGTPYKLRYLKSPMQQVVGNVLFHGTKDDVDATGNVVNESLLSVAQREGKINAGADGLYTDPWAAIGYTRGGKNPGILMVVSDSEAVKTGAKGLAEGLTQSDSFVKGAQEGFYGSSKSWKGDLETEIVGAPGTKVEVPPPTADLVTRATAGTYADFFTSDGRQFVPIKVGLDTVNLNPQTAAVLKQPVALYAVKLYTLYNALRDTSEAVRHPDLALKDTWGILKQSTDLERVVREGTGKGGYTPIPGLRDVYLEQGIGSRLAEIMDRLTGKAAEKTREELPDAKVDSEEFKKAFDSNMESAYRESADSLIRSFGDIATKYAASQDVRGKFENGYVASLGASMEALVKSSEVNLAQQKIASSESKTQPISSDVVKSVTEYSKAVSSAPTEKISPPSKKTRTTESPSSVASAASSVTDVRSSLASTSVRPSTVESARGDFLGISSVPSTVVPITEIETRPPVSSVTLPPPPPSTSIPRTELDDKAKQDIIQNPPDGTVVWIQGRPMSRTSESHPMFKIVAPPYKEIFTSRDTPKGYRDEGYTGKGAAFKSIQVLGGKLDKNIENLDLGFARVNIKMEGGKPSIEYAEDQGSNVGTRSETVGQGEGQIPIEEWETAKAQGVSFADFLATYKGHYVGQPHPEGSVRAKKTDVEDVNIVWVDSAKELPREKETIGANAPDESIVGYYDDETNTIYGIKDVTTNFDIEHEKYHALMKHKETEDPRQFVREELEAENYAFEQTGELGTFHNTLWGLLNDLTDYSYHLSPQESWKILSEEFNKQSLPDAWVEDFNKVECEFKEAHPQEFENDAECASPGEILAKSNVEKRAQSLNLRELVEYRTPKTIVELVDGDYVRDHIDINFVDGGNWKRYSYIPKYHYWVEDNMNEEDTKATLLHELVEVPAMGVGRGDGKHYGDAHYKVANPTELYARQHPDKLDSMIEDTLSQYRKPEPKKDESIFAKKRHPSRFDLIKDMNEHDEESDEELEDGYAEESEPEKPVVKSTRRIRQMNLTGGTYLGHSLPPPDLGAAL